MGTAEHLLHMGNLFSFTFCFLDASMHLYIRVCPMPAYPMGKMGYCPGPRTQGGPALAEGVMENQGKRGERKKNKMK